MVTFLLQLKTRLHEDLWSWESLLVSSDQCFMVVFVVVLFTINTEAVIEDDEDDEDEDDDEHVLWFWNMNLID